MRRVERTGPIQVLTSECYCPDGDPLRFCGEMLLIPIWLAMARQVFWNGGWPATACGQYLQLLPFHDLRNCLSRHTQATRSIEREKERKNRRDAADYTYTPTFVVMFRSLALSASKSSSRATTAALRVNQTVVRTRGYHENVISHYENPRNVRSARFLTHEAQSLTYYSLGWFSSQK
jgi:hypothetical protein